MDLAWTALHGPSLLSTKIEQGRRCSAAVNPRGITYAGCVTGCVAGSGPCPAGGMSQIHGCVPLLSAVRSATLSVTSLRRDNQPDIAAVECAAHVADLPRQHSRNGPLTPLIRASGASSALNAPIICGSLPPVCEVSRPISAPGFSSVLPPLITVSRFVVVDARCLCSRENLHTKA